MASDAPPSYTAAAGNDEGKERDENDDRYTVKISSWSMNDVVMITDSKNDQLIDYMKQWFINKTHSKEKDVKIKEERYGLNRVIFNNATKDKKFGLSYWRIFFSDAMMQYTKCKYSMVAAATSSISTLYFIPE